MHPEWMDIGFTPTPKEAAHWFDMIQTAPAFTRVFSPRGHGLPNLDGVATRQLAPETMPWYSHKDPIGVGQVAATWETLVPKAQPYRWTFHHEAAPQDTAYRAAYKNYWYELQQAARDFPHIELVQIQSNYAMLRRVDTRWEDWIIPGISLGFDCYPLAGYRYEPPAAIFGLVQHAAKTYGCPSWGVPELGADQRPNQNRGLWLVECVDYLKAAGAAYVGLWATQEERDGHHYDYRPTDPGTLEAVRLILKENQP